MDTYILYNDATSPFGRKALVTALELDLPITERFVSVFDYDSLTHVTPLHQIPALRTPDGDILFDSNVIVSTFGEYAEREAMDRHSMNGPQLTFLAAMDGLMETVLKRTLELKQAETQQRRDFIQSMTTRVEDCLAWLNTNSEALHDQSFGLAHIYAACALDYCNFRYGSRWRTCYPTLSDWLDHTLERPSLACSTPTRTSPHTDNRSKVVA